MCDVLLQGGFFSDVTLNKSLYKRLSFFLFLISNLETFIFTKQPYGSNKVSRFHPGIYFLDYIDCVTDCLLN